MALGRVSGQFARFAALGLAAAAWPGLAAPPAQVGPDRATLAAGNGLSHSSAPASDPADGRELVVTARAPAPRPQVLALDPGVVPHAYRLDLTVDPASPRFSGIAEIDVTLGEPQAVIALNGRGLDVTRAEARLADGTRLEGAWRQTDAAGRAELAFPRPLPAGRAVLVLAWSAAFSAGPWGLFRQEVDGQWFAWSQLESIDARAVFPGFDSPAFRTPFALTLRTPPGSLAVSNAPEAGPAMVEQGLAVHRFAPTAPLPTYLLAVMAGPFAVHKGSAAPGSARSQPLPMRALAPPSAAAGLARGTEASAAMLRSMEDWFGSPYPFAKLDQITTPMLPGAMENPGAVLYRDDLLAPPPGASPTQQREMARVIGHELAHQWFGGLVTPARWDDLWLNESFANWLGYRMADRWRPDLGLGTAAIREGFAAMETDALLAGRPVTQAITRDEDADAAFDAITYGKGGHIVGQIAQAMGEEPFRDAVRAYLAARPMGTATSADFFAALAAAPAGKPLVAALRSMVEQQGVPLLALRREGGGRVTVSQTRYVHLGTAAPDTLWHVPVCLRRGETRTCRVLTHRTESFVVPGKGLLFPNAGGEGYLRFELAALHWAELTRVADRLPAGEALALADSLEGSILAGRGTVGEMARLAARLSRHADPDAAVAADRALARLVTMGLVGAQGRWQFGMLRQRLYGKEMDRLGFDPRAGAYATEPVMRARRRALVMASLLGTQRGAPLRRALDRAARAYLAGDATALDPMWFDHAFDIHLFLGGENAARALVARALAAPPGRMRSAALAAAARSSDREVAAWLLDLDDPRLGEGERRDVLDAIMARSATRALGYDWIVAHADRLTGGSAGTFFARQLPAMVGRFCEAGQAIRIERDLGPKLAGTAAALDLARAVERVRECAAFQREYGPVIESGFARLK